MKRTSISISHQLNEALTCAAVKSGLSKATLVRRCLKRSQKSEHLASFGKGVTLAYNRDECKSKFYFYMSEPMHNYAQVMRFKAKISFSFLVTKALEKFLDSFLQMLNSRFNLKYFALIDCLGESLHRRIRFQHRSGYALSIVMHRTRAPG